MRGKSDREDFFAFTSGSQAPCEPGRMMQSFSSRLYADVCSGHRFEKSPSWTVMESRDEAGPRCPYASLTPSSDGTQYAPGENLMSKASLLELQPAPACAAPHASTAWQR